MIKHSLKRTLESISSKDNHIQKLLEISKKSINNEKKQKIKLSFFRNVYILDKDQKFLFLKEFRTNTKNFELYIPIFYSIFSIIIVKNIRKIFPNIKKKI